MDTYPEIASYLVRVTVRSDSTDAPTNEEIQDAVETAIADLLSPTPVTVRASSERLDK